eukprot:GHUV01006493.1.p1 GENE.GHUV01006493.1~~GHUV01006493.1.p1  ORF type:complete len:145 (+),score=65.04 GHUV01006493.1:500-934(+)
MAELLTQLQDDLFSICWKFRDCVGVLQGQAPPQQVATEALLAKPPVPGFDVQSTVKTYTTEIIDLIKAFDGLLHQLPDDLVQPSSADSRRKQEYETEIRQLQQQHQQVTDELAAAVEEVEGLLSHLQQLYAALAQAKLQAMSSS